MKNILTLLLFLFTRININAQTISFPIDRAVFQRNSNAISATAPVTFAGVITENASGTSTTNNSTYEIRRLRLDGVDVGAYQSPTTFQASEKTRIGTSLGYTFYFTKNIPTGWYQLKVKNGSNNVISTIKFGVGEVFVIAGQSNAQGYGIGTYGVSGVNNTYDCVEALKNVTVSPYGDGVGEVNDFTNLERPIFGLIRYSTDINNQSNNNPWIGPKGTRTWYYQYLGEQITTMHGTSTNTTNSNYSSQPPVPVMFYNVAVAATSINNWEGAMLKTRAFFSSNYSNTLNISNGNSVSTGTISGLYINNPWTFPPNYNELFTTLKNVLSFYGGMFGIRAILWHQGEAETKTLLNQFRSGVYNLQGPVPSNYKITDYQARLKNIIDETRIILPGLQWGISKVSLISEYLAGSTTLTHQNIVNDYSYTTLGQSWVYSKPNIVNPMSPFEVKENGLSSTNSNVIKQQELLQSANPTYISWFTQSSDSYSTVASIPLLGTINCRIDGTHFNSAGLSFMGSNAYSNITTNILTKSPVLAIPIPKVTLVKSSNVYVANVTAPAGIIYQSIQWTGYTSTKFNQSAPNSLSTYSISNQTPYINSCTGFVKDNKGRISIIPYTHIAVSGARVNIEETQVLVYPNPLANDELLNIEYEIDEDNVENVDIEIIDKNGIKLYTEKFKKLSVGKNVFTLKNIFSDNIQDFDFIYVRIIASNKVTTQKLLLQH